MLEKYEYEVYFRFLKGIRQEPMARTRPERVKRSIIYLQLRALVMTEAANWKSFDRTLSFDSISTEVRREETANRRQEPHLTKFLFDISFKVYQIGILT